MPSDPYEIVTTGAKMMCTEGLLPGVFQSTHDAVFTTGGFSNAATADVEALENIPSFLICKHPQNFFKKCVPMPPPGPVSAWENTHPAQDSGEEILLVRSCTTCMNGPGSKINFLDSGQVGPSIFKVMNPIEEEIAEIEAALEELEPGTPEYDELLRELADLKNRNTDFNNLPLGGEMVEYFDDNISEQRQGELSDLHRELVDNYLQDGELSHTNIAQILDDLRDMDTLSDVEKAYVWTELANNKEGGAWIFGVGGDDGDYVINNGGVNPDVIDSAIFNGDATQVHTVVGFTDGYHGRMGGITGDNGAAEIEIEEHEAGQGLPGWFITIPRLSPNEGDANASLATVDAFRGFREDGFDEFADRWQDNMLAPPEEVINVPTGTTTPVPVPAPVPPVTTTTTPPYPPTGTTTTTTTTTTPSPP